MAIAVVQSKVSTSAGAATITLGAATTVGNWLLVYMAHNSTNPPSAAAGWTLWQGKSDPVGSNMGGGLYYQQVALSSSIITPILSPSTPNPYAVWELSGLPNGFPADIQDAAFNIGVGSPTTFVPKPMRSQNTGLLLTAIMSRNSTVAPTVGGMTYDHTDSFALNGSRDVVAAYKATVAGTTYTPTATPSTTAAWHYMELILNGNYLGSAELPGAVIREESQGMASQPIVLPWVPTVNNYLVAVVTQSSGVVPAANTGWTAFDSIVDAATFVSSTLFYRKVQSGDTNSITPASSFASPGAYSVIEYDAAMPNGLPTDFTTVEKAVSTTGASPSFSAVSAGYEAIVGHQRTDTGFPTFGGITPSLSSGMRGGSRGSFGASSKLTGSVTPTLTYSASGLHSASWSINTASGGGPVTSLPGKGSTTFTGFAPTPKITSLPGAGSAAFTGYTPSTFLGNSVGLGSLICTGFAPTQRITALPGAGAMTFTGYPLTPPATHQINASQFGALVAALPDLEVRASQFGLGAIADINLRIRVTQMGLMVIAMGGDTPLRPDPLVLSDLGRQPVLRQRLVNMYVEPTPQGPNRNGHFQRPGLKSVRQLGGAIVNCTFQWQGFQYTVTDNTVWRDFEDIGTIPTSAEVRFATSETQIVIVTGGKAYVVTTTDVTLITDHDLPDNVIDVVQLAGRFIYIIKDTGKWYYSMVGIAEDIDGLNFATTEASSDTNTGASVVGDLLAIFGTRTAEWWYPTTDQSAPFKRSAGRSWNKGLASLKTLRLADNALWFIGQDKMVYRSGAVPTVMSDDQVSDHLRRVDTDDLDKCSAFVISYGKHVFYVLHIFGQGSWAYDIPNQKWAEWKTHGKDRFRINCADEFLMGDYYTGTLMTFDGGVFTDVLDPIERVVSTFASIKSGVMTNFNAVLRCLMGVGLPDGYSSDPIVEMRNSDDLGKTWTPWQASRLGKMGERDKIVEWIQQGQMRAPGRLFEFRCSDPVYFAPYEALFNEERA